MSKIRTRCAQLAAAAVAASALAIVTTGSTQPIASAGEAEGFRSVEYVRGLLKPTAMDFAPDGRIFVAQKEGKVRVVSADGELREAPALDIEAKVDPFRERGLLGVEFDRDFATTGHVFLFYSSNVGGCHHVVSRFTVVGDDIDPASELELLDLGPCGSGGHNGGAIHTGNDGTLFINAGEQNRANYSQDKTNLFGKVLRINTDGTIPTDNPFYDELEGELRAIYAMGLRNPFSGGVDPATGDYFVNDVGEHEWEEVNHVTPGANFGWPLTEGDFDPAEFPDFTQPVHTYRHGPGEFEGCAVVGGVFYRSEVSDYPSGFQGDWLFADYCNAYIHRLDRETGKVTSLVTDVSLLADIDIGPDGDVYYLDRRGGQFLSFIHRLERSNKPGVFRQPNDLVVSETRTAQFRVTASGNGPYTYQWFRDGVLLDGETERNLEFVAELADTGATFRVEISNAAGTVESDVVTLTVLDFFNDPPEVRIDSPNPANRFRGSDVIDFAARATDREDGSLPDEAFVWEIVLHHADHTHPFIEEYVGRTGQLTVPFNDHTDANIYYRFNVTVTDSEGASTTESIDIEPRRVRVRLLTEPRGLPLLVNGQPQDTFHRFDSVTGVQQLLEAPATATKKGVEWEFDSWFGATPSTRKLITAGNQRTYVANYRVAGGVVGEGTGLLGTYYDNADFTEERITRRDRVINFVWRDQKPHGSIEPDSFSVIWEGELLPQFTEQYRIQAIARGDVKVVVDGKTVADGSAPTRKWFKGFVSLTAGEKVPIRVEYSNPTDTGIIELLWESPSTPLSPIPRSQLS